MTQSPIRRRGFLTGAAVGLSAGVLASSPDISAQSQRFSGRLPREIWIASVTLERLQPKSGEDMVNQVLRRMEATLVHQPDIICIPECYPFLRISNAPPLSEQADQASGWISEKMAAFAKANQCYVISPMHTKENSVIYNSAVLFNREGKKAGEYHKIHPTVDEIDEGVTPGSLDPPVFQTDFGVIGIQICFDINWPEGWRWLRKKGAEIIFWPSAFPAGRMLNGMAWMNKTYVVSSTWDDPTRIIDITGDEVAASGHFEPWICAPVNLEKAFIHIWPYLKNMDGLRAKYGRKVRVTKMHEENWAIIESVSAEVSLKQALEEFEIPLHEEHIQRADVVQNKTRKA